MMVVRPVREEDLEGLEQLAQQAGIGLTTLPKDRKLLAQKIQDSLQSFHRMIEGPGEEAYLFVLEDQATNRIAGVCGILASISQPFYSYKLGTLVQSSKTLKITKELQVLYLVNDYRQTSEICTLFLNPEFRREHNGKLLSLSRLLFMAEFPLRFAPKVIADMRGMVDEKGLSPFWRNLGGRFFDMDFSEADYLTAVGDKQFIADLMPKYPIYVALLSSEAQEVIGKVQPATRPALEMLKAEGFRWEGYVDIFDAGPTIEAPLTQIATVRESRKRLLETWVEELPGPLFLLSNARLEARITLGPLELLPQGTVRLTSKTAQALQLQPGDPVRYLPLQH